MGGHHVEAALGPGGVGGLDEAPVVQRGAGEDDLGLRVAGLDRRVGGTQHARVLGGVGAGRPEALEVRLVPDLVGLDALAGVALGDEAGKGGELGVVARRGVLGARGRCPLGRLVQHDEHALAGGLGAGDGAVVLLEPPVVVGAARGLGVAPADAEAHHARARVLEPGGGAVLLGGARVPGHVGHEAGLEGLGAGRQREHGGTRRGTGCGTATAKEWASGGHGGKRRSGRLAWLSAAAGQGGSGRPGLDEGTRGWVVVSGTAGGG